MKKNDCQVLNADGIDVTRDFLTPIYDVGQMEGTAFAWATAGAITGNKNNGNDGMIMEIEEYVDCQGNYICQNFTITDCPAIVCDGPEACFEASLLNVGRILECRGTHGCHRATISFLANPEPAVSSSAGTDTDNEVTTKTRPSTTLTNQLMYCGAASCNVAEIIYAPHLHLECVGPKACRKISMPTTTTTDNNNNEEAATEVAAVTMIGSVHCTQGSIANPACTDKAKIQTDCLLCGVRGCHASFNQCQVYDTELEKYVNCQPHQAMGKGCSDAQIQALHEEIQRDEEG